MKQRAHLLIGLLLLSQSFVVQADGTKQTNIIDLQKEVAKLPQDIKLRIALMDAYIDTRQYTKAEIELNKIKQQDAQPALWGLSAAKIYMGLEKPKEAIQLLNEINNPSDKKIHALLLAEAYMMDKNLEQAKKYYKSEWIKDEPIALIGLVQIAINQNNLEEAQKYLTKAMKLNEASDNIGLASQYHHYQAEIYRQQKNTKQAEAEYKLAIKLNEHNLPAHLHYVSFLLMQRNMPDFSKEVDMLYQKMPKHVMVMYYAAIDRLEKHRYEDAQKILDEAMRLHPKFAENYLLMARSYFDGGQYLMAEQFLKQYMKLKPNHLVATKLLAGIYLKLNQIDDALALLKPLEKTHGKDYNFLSLYGTALLLHQETEKAQAILSKANEYNNDNPVISTELALAHLQQGEYDQAQDILQKLVDTHEQFIQADVMLVLSLLSSKSYTRAENVAQNMIAKKPEHPAPYNLLGMVYEQEKKYDQAKKNYQKALEKDPQFLLARNNLSELYLLQDNFSAAEKNIQDTLKSHAGDIRALFLMAYSKEKSNLPKEALQWLQKAKTLNPNHFLPSLQLIDFYVRAGDLDKANQESKLVLEKFPKTVPVLAKTANLKLLSKSYDEAFKIFETWQGLDKSNPMIDYQMGRLSLMRNKESDAVFYLNQALSKQKDYVPALILKSNYLLGKSKIAESKILAEQLLKIAPDKDFAHLQMGKVLYVAKQYPESIVYFKNAYERVPSFENAAAYFDGLVANQNVDQAFDMMNQWRQKHPQHVGVRRFIGLKSTQMGRVESAVQAYEEVLKLSKGDFVTYNNLATLYAPKDLKKAHDYAEKAYQLSPKQPKVLDTLGWILVQKQEPKKGLVFLEQANRFDPDSNDIRYHLARALYEVGSKQEAYRLLKTSLDHGKEIDPGFNEKKQAKVFFDRMKSEMAQSGMDIQ